MPNAPALPPLVSLLLAFALALAMPVAALAPAPARAQGEPEFFDVPYAPNQWNLGRRLNEEQFRYCIDRRDPDWEVAGAIADAIAEALLLEPQRYMVEADLVSEDITKVYGVLLEHCDLHMGFKLIPEGYGSWAMLTRAYYETQYDFVTGDPNINALADLPYSRPIGATLGTSAHIRLVSYLMQQPADKRWAIFPYGTDDLALESVQRGTIGVALVWAPNLWAKQRSDRDFSGLRVIDPAPQRPTTLGVGALMLSNETFLRTAVDQAITALIDDGTIQSILDSFRFPATAPR